MENFDTDIIDALQKSEQHISNLQNIINILLNKNKELIVKNETWERVSNSKNNFEMAAVAKIINYCRNYAAKLQKVS
jgi:hypothetical protein